MQLIYQLSVKENEICNPQLSQLPLLTLSHRTISEAIGPDSWEDDDHSQRQHSWLSIKLKQSSLTAYNIFISHYSCKDIYHAKLARTFSSSSRLKPTYHNPYSPNYCLNIISVFATAPSPLSETGSPSTYNQPYL